MSPSSSTYIGTPLLPVSTTAPLTPIARLNWWPTTLGGTVSYFVFWALPLFVGYLLHYFELDGFGTRRGDAKPGDRARSNYDWERKTTWVVLAFTTMLLPAVVCFSKLRADRRQTFRRSLTPAQKTCACPLTRPPGYQKLMDSLNRFLERQLASRMPRSYKRFLWFMLTFTLSLIALILGQGFATIYLSTLPHSNLDGVVYVYSWILTIQCLNGISNWILQNKVRSRALVFVFRVRLPSLRSRLSHLAYLLCLLSSTSSSCTTSCVLLPGSPAPSSSIDPWPEVLSQPLRPVTLSRPGAIHPTPLLVVGDPVVPCVHVAYLPQVRRSYRAQHGLMS